MYKQSRGQRPTSPALWSPIRGGPQCMCQGCKREKLSNFSLQMLKQHGLNLHLCNEEGMPLPDSSAEMVHQLVLKDINKRLKHHPFLVWRELKLNSPSFCIHFRTFRVKCCTSESIRRNDWYCKQNRKLENPREPTLCW